MSPINNAILAQVTLLVLANVQLQPVAALIKVATPEALEQLFGFDISSQDLTKKVLDPIDLFLEDILPTWFGQAPNNQNGTRSEYRAYNLEDNSNDDAVRLTGQQLISRSGFKYEVFDAIAEDGYITQLTHLINPLADRTKLRQPPVLMEHGGSIDPTAYLLASSIQHFPEPWPRKPEDGPMRSWNRSLAFQLANNGFDVWLAETRGSNDRNKRHIRPSVDESLVKGKETAANRTNLDKMKEVIQSINYWAFSQDDIVEFELKSHIDSVLQLTGSTKLNLMTFSLSTPTSFAFLASKPNYAEKINGYVSMAPIISGEGTSRFITFVFKTVCPMMPDEIGTLLMSDLLLTQPFRELFLLLSKNKEVRYVLFKSVSTLLMGASPKWQTLLDLNLIGHLFRQLSFRELKQMCQQMSSNKLQKFDYGPIKNQIIYKQTKPPVYDISHLRIKNWIVVSGTNDALSTPAVIEHLMSIVNPKPIYHVKAPNFNHLDLFAGWENDIYVNEPIRRYFEQMSVIPGYTNASKARNLVDLPSIVPEFLQPNRVMKQAQNITKQFLPPNPLDPKEFVENLSKSLKTFVESFTGEFGRKFLSNLGKRKEGNEQQADNNKIVGADLKNNLEKILGGLKAPTSFEKLTKNFTSLLDSKRLMDNLSQTLGGLGAKSTGLKRNGSFRFGDFLENPLKSLTDNIEKKDDLVSGATKPTDSGSDKSLIAASGLADVVGITVKNQEPNKSTSPTETLRDLADVAAGAEAAKKLAAKATKQSEGVLKNLASVVTGQQDPKANEDIANPMKAIAGLGSQLGNLSNMMKGTLGNFKSESQ